MDKKRREHWDNLINSRVQSDNPEVKDMIMNQAKDYDSISTKTDSYLMELTQAGYRPETIAFAVAQSLSVYLKAITTMEVMKYGEPRLHKILGDLIISEGGPVPEDALDEILKPIFGPKP